MGRRGRCDQCGQSGFKGRIAVHEVLALTDEIRDLISNRAAEHVVRKAARRAGMRTLLADGIAKAAVGLTTLEEVLGVVSRGDGVEAPMEVASTAAAPRAPKRPRCGAACSSSKTARRSPPW